MHNDYAPTRKNVSGFDSVVPSLIVFHESSAPEHKQGSGKRKAKRSEPDQEDAASEKEKLSET